MYGPNTDLVIDMTGIATEHLNHLCYIWYCNQRITTSKHYRYIDLLQAEDSGLILAAPD
jgi:hypothetical protein